MDFLKGYKTISGVVIVILSVFLGSKVSGEELGAVATQIGEIIGMILTVYGLIMKIIRKFKETK